MKRPSVSCSSLEVCNLSRNWEQPRTAFQLLFPTYFFLILFSLFSYNSFSKPFSLALKVAWNFLVRNQFPGFFAHYFFYCNFFFTIQNVRTKLFSVGVTMYYRYYTHLHYIIFWKHNTNFFFSVLNQTFTWYNKTCLFSSSDFRPALLLWGQRWSDCRICVWKQIKAHHFMFQ